MFNQTENIVYPTGDPLSGPNFTILLGTVLWIVGAIIMGIVCIFGNMYGLAREKVQSFEKNRRTLPSKVNSSASG